MSSTNRGAEHHCTKCGKKVPPPLMLIGEATQFCADCIKAGIKHVEAIYFPTTKTP